MFDKLNFKNEKVSLPIYVLDDTELLRDYHTWTVTVSAYNGNLEKIAAFEKNGKGGLSQVKQIGSLTLTEQMTDTDPLFIVSEIGCDEKEPIRSFYWFNYQYDKDWIAKLPKAVLNYNKIFQSMSRKGNCYDNSIMENFFGILKQEMYYGITYYSFDELKHAIEQYIRYYNEKRIKEKLGWMSPVEYRISLLAA